MRWQCDRIAVLKEKKPVKIRINLHLPHGPAEVITKGRVNDQSILIQIALAHRENKI